MRKFILLFSLFRMWAHSCKSPYNSCYHITYASARDHSMRERLTCCPIIWVLRHVSTAIFTQGISTSPIVSPFSRICWWVALFEADPNFWGFTLATEAFYTHTTIQVLQTLNRQTWSATKRLLGERHYHVILSFYVKFVYVLERFVGILDWL